MGRPVMLSDATVQFPPVGVESSSAERCRPRRFPVELGFVPRLRQRRQAQTLDDLY